MSYPIVIFGTGVAGLRAAVELLENGKNVLVVTKDKIDLSNTDKAQGGIAVVMNRGDNFEKHIEDTLKAGAGLCNRKSVEILVEEGPDRVRELIDWGANFDKNKQGELDFTREAAHGMNRILHALGDATGHEVERTLVEKFKSFANAHVLENNILVDILTNNGTVSGVRLFDRTTKKYNLIEAQAVILATGGYAAIYKNTTNPSITTGDGIASAFLAGADLEDMEFVQFHPTALKRYNAPQFLLSESMRGEGAILINDKGEQFMEKYHRLKELAPRDVVARSIIFEMKKRSIDKVYLDTSPMGADFARNRFPTIYNECLKYDLDITKEAIPVAPAAHYTMGGVKTDVYSRTNIDGLFAAGEAACNGVHGANRLASNSILEGLVFGKRAAVSALEYIDSNKYIGAGDYDNNISECSGGMDRLIDNIKEKLWNKLGVVRNINDVKEMFEYTSALLAGHNKTYNCESGILLRNIVVLASVIAKSALERKGSVGAHYCVDTPHAYEKKQHVILNKKDFGEFL